MLQSSARFCAHQLFKAIPLCAVSSRVGSRLVASLPQANEHVDGQRSLPQTRDTDLVAPKAASFATKRLDDSLFWPEDLTETYVQRHVSRHFDTVIDPKFSAQTGLPMTVYISQKQYHRPASIEVSQFYGKHHNLRNIFTITIPRATQDTPRIIGDTGAIKLKDIAKAYQFIEVNRKLLLDVWEHGRDEANEVAWNYYEYVVPLP